MKHGFLIVFILVCYLPLHAQKELQHKVVLQNGNILRGQLIEHSDPDTIVIKTLDDSLHVYALNQVKEVGETTRKERRKTIDRSLDFFLRSEVTLGYGYSAALSAGIQFCPYYSFYWGFGGWNVRSSVWHMVYVGNLVHFSRSKKRMFVDVRLGLGKEVIFEEDGVVTNWRNDKKMVSLGIGESFGSIDVGLYGSLFTTANNTKTKPCIGINLSYNFQ